MKLLDRIRAAFPRRRRRQIGFLEATLFDGELCVSFSGNMGATIERNVDPCLKRLSLPSVAELKTLPHAERGSPDYSWSIQVKVNTPKSRRKP